MISESFECVDSIVHLVKERQYCVQIDETFLIKNCSGAQTGTFMSCRSESFVLVCLVYIQRKNHVLTTKSISLDNLMENN